MNLKINLLDSGLVYRNPKPYLHAIHAMHPTISLLPNGKLVCAFDIGQGSESLDYHSVLARSNLALWRRIRGEGYTEFYRQARAITREAGKTLGVHIDHVSGIEPEEGAGMEIHWDWRTWIGEGLADYVMLKGVFPGTPFAREITALARPQGIDVVAAFFAFTHKWKEPGSEQLLDAHIRAFQEQGCDGFQYYDSAGLLHGIEDRQRVVVKNPVLREVLCRHFI